MAGTRFNAVEPFVAAAKKRPVHFIFPGHIKKMKKDA